MTGGDAELAAFRAQFPITRSRAFLFNGAIAPAARRVRAAAEAWLESWEERPLEPYDALEEQARALRDAFAGLIGADPRDVAITDNTSRGANLAVRLLSRRPGRYVVCDDTTYPSSLYPWMTMTDKEIRYVESGRDADAGAELAAAIGDETAAVTVSHVSPLTGRRHDLRRLARAVHARGGLLLVDAAQSTGVVPIDVTQDGIDVLVTTAMKWMLGPPGIGFAYVRRELFEAGGIEEMGYLAIAHLGERWPRSRLPDRSPDARQFELGFPSLSGLAAAREGILLLRELGVERVQARIEELVTRCLHGLLERGVRVRTPLDLAGRAGVIAFDHEAPHRLAAFLRARGVDIGGYPWGLGRIDPHAFNDASDVERLLAGYDEFAAGGQSAT